MRLIFFLFTLIIGCGVARSQLNDTLSLKTNYPIGTSLSLTFNNAALLSIDWGDGTFEDYYSYADSISGTVRGSNIKIIGSNITYVDFSNGGIEEANVSRVKNLTSLNCSFNKLTVLDLSANTQLETLNCSYNDLKTLTTIQSSLLTDLVANNNQLEQVSFTLSSLIRSLVLNDNQLVALDVNGLSGLKTLWCQNNKIENLNLSSSILLESILCFNNNLKTLNVNGLSRLTQLWCDVNKIPSLDLSSNMAISYLSANNAEISQLRLPKPNSIKTLYLNDNKLTFATLLPAASLSDYVYSPQASMQLFPTDLYVVNLSSQFTSMDATSTNPVVKWYSDGTLLQTAIDYSEQGGVYTFKNSCSTVVCQIESGVFPGLTLTSAPIQLDTFASVHQPDDTNTLRITSGKGMLTICSSKAQRVVVTTINGISIKKFDKLFGSQLLALPSGTYCVNNQKVIVM